MKRPIANPITKQLFIATAVATLALSAPIVFADPPGQDKAAKHYYKAQEKAHKEHHKAVRKAIKEDQKAYRKWARGQHIPRDYLVERYYITDYRVYDLAPPPRGYMWVRPYPQDDTFYMVQLATGLISEIFGR
jgi:Ni/Co efflux regulator RcnB